MLNQVGIENFRILAPAQSVTINEGHHRAFTLSGLSDGWARNIEVFNTVNSVSVTGRRITVDNLSIIHDVPTIGAAKPADLNGSGYQLLFNVAGDPVGDIVRAYRQALEALHSGATIDLQATLRVLGREYTRGHFARAV